MPPTEDHRSYLGRFLEYLTQRRDDRGVMADLRHGFSAATEHRAWPHLAPWCDLRRDRDRHILLVVAGGFALHGGTAGGAGNFGATMRQLAGGDGVGEQGLRSFDGRFRRLLACLDVIDLCHLLPSVLRAAAQRSIPVDYVRLGVDLRYWGDATRTAWAAAFWGAPVEVPATAEETVP